MNREEKAAVIDQIAGELGRSEAIFALDYRGITVAQIAELRDKLRASETKLRVAKNSLSERAADQAGVAEVKSLLVGPTALALVTGDAAAAAKVLSDTSRALRGPLTFKGGFMGGSLLSAGEVEAIAKLPSRDVLNAQLVGTIAAPLTGLARTLNALIQGVASQLGQIRDQGLVGGSADSSATDASSTEQNDSVSDTPAAEESIEAAALAEAGATAAGADTDAGEAETAAETATVDGTRADGGSETESNSSVEEPLTAEAATNIETEGSSDDEPSDN